MKHLSDDELQLYLIGKSGDRAEHIARHLEDCSECRRQLAVYKALDRSLEVREDVGFGHGFDEAVMNRIHTLKNKPDWVSDFAVVGFALIGIVGIVLFLILSDTFRNLFSQGFSYIAESVKAYTISSVKFGEWLKFALAALFIVFCYGILDRILMRGKKVNSNYIFL